MNPIQITILGSLLLVACARATAVPAQPACNDEPLIEVRSLQALPAEISTLLGVEREGRVEIADRGEEFQIGDVLIGERLPFRRFAIAGLNTICALIAVERGGRGYSVELFYFKYVGATWQPDSRIVMFEAPQSLEELTAYSN
jgi:hypothetical protein